MCEDTQNLNETKSETFATSHVAFRLIGCVYSVNAKYGIAGFSYILMYNPSVKKICHFQSMQISSVKFPCITTHQVVFSKLCRLHSSGWRENIAKAV